MSTSDEWDDMLDDCEKRSEKLTDWETNFVSSLIDQRFKSLRLSYSQVQILDEIWERVTENG